jgi:hypothetical protein
MARSVQSSACRPYSTNLVEGGFRELRSLTEFCDVNTIPTDPLNLFSELLAIVDLFGAWRLSQQSNSFPSPEEAPTHVYGHRDSFIHLRASVNRLATFYT